MGGLNPDRLSVDLHIQLAEGATGSCKLGVPLHESADHVPLVLTSCQSAGLVQLCRPIPHLSVRPHARMAESSRLAGSVLRAMQSRDPHPGHLGNPVQGPREWSVFSQVRNVGTSCCCRPHEFRSVNLPKPVVAQMPKWMICVLSACQVDQIGGSAC